MEIIRSVLRGVEAHLQGTWEMVKSDKLLYNLFHISNTTNDDYMKEFDTYVKVIDYYGGNTPIHPELVKYNRTNMGLKDINNPKPK